MIAGEPCIVAATSTWRAPLADVLIVAAGPAPPAEVFQRVFAENPGLTLALVVQSDTAAQARFRSGPEHTVPLVRPLPGRSWEDLAVALYRSWVGDAGRLRTGEPSAS